MTDMLPFVDPRSGMLARHWDDKRKVWGALKRRPKPAPQPCIHCGALTERTVIGGLCEKVKQPGEAEQSNQISPGSIGYGLHPTTWEVLFVCDECERRRCIGQYKQVAANPDVYPSLREAAIAALGSLPDTAASVRAGLKGLR